MIILNALDIITNFKPGSHDQPWSWMQEFADIYERETNAFLDLVWDIRENGIKEPILLGDDGRIWDGHHRICAAIYLDWNFLVPVEERSNYADSKNQTHV